MSTRAQSPNPAIGQKNCSTKNKGLMPPFLEKPTPTISSHSCKSPETSPNMTAATAFTPSCPNVKRFTISGNFILISLFTTGVNGKIAKTHSVPAAGVAQGIWLFSKSALCKKQNPPETSGGYVLLQKSGHYPGLGLLLGQAQCAQLHYLLAGYLADGRLVDKLGVAVIGVQGR